MTGTVVGARCFAPSARAASAFNLSDAWTRGSCRGISLSSAAAFASNSVRLAFKAGVSPTGRVGVSSERSASAVLLKKAKSAKYSVCVIGSYLCVWHCAQASDVPIQTVSVVLTRSTTATLRNSSSLVPPSLLVIVLRWNAVAIRWSSVASGSRSPASCSTVKRSNGRLRLYARTTQSR